MKHFAILLAAGSSSRMGASVHDKILLEIGGKSVFQHSLDAFQSSNIVDGAVIVCRDNQQRKILAREISSSTFNKPVLYTMGGKERQDSVRNALNTLNNETHFVYIHDCARPAIHPDSLKSLRSALLDGSPAVVLGHRIVDTVRMYSHSPIDKPAKGEVVDRSKLWAMETPQAFRRDLIEKAYLNLKHSVTDDVSAVEALGISALVIESTQPNPKLTRPADLPLLENVLAKVNNSPLPSSKMRVGFGYDIHRFAENLPLTIGGVRIPADFGLEGHSDADVLSHAIADAILGACGLPDIGHFFPNTDPAIKGISSLEIIKRAVSEARELGFSIINVDATIIAEKPKILPFVARMKNSLSLALGVPVSNIGIKATTNEKLGSLGRSQGMAAQAVVLLANK